MKNVELEQMKLDTDTAEKWQGYLTNQNLPDHSTEEILHKIDQELSFGIQIAKDYDDKVLVRTVVYYKGQIALEWIESKDENILLSTYTFDWDDITHKIEVGI